jgi:hypothetical protein
MKTPVFKVPGPLTHACQSSFDFERDKTYQLRKEILCSAL